MAQEIIIIRVRDFLKKRGVKYSKVAEVSGVSQQLLNQYLNNAETNGGFPAWIIPIICDLTNETADTFFSETIMEKV